VTGQPSAGWYPDPSRQAFERYWDGRAWTARVRSAPSGRTASTSSKPGSPLQPAPSVDSGAAYGSRSASSALPARLAAVPLSASAEPSGVMSARGPGDRLPRAARRPGLAPSVVALVMLIPALVGALTIVAPIAYGLGLLWPIWGIGVPFVVWVAGAVLAAWPQERIQRSLHGYRDPTTEELRRIREPVRGALHRTAVSASRMRLMIVSAKELNASATAGRTVVITSYAANSLPPDRLEAVLAHELTHHVGLQAVPVFCHAQLMLPIRTLWWLLARIWRPVRRMWRVAVAWHTPFGFLVTFLLAIVAALMIVVSAIPACIAFLGSTLSRVSTDQTEFQADTTVAGLGLGPQLLAALEAAIDAGHVGTVRAGRLLGLPPLEIRRAQRLRKKLAR
jgi:Zn-dependent protease with chaperone function